MVSQLHLHRKMLRSTNVCMTDWFHYWQSANRCMFLEYTSYKSSSEWLFRAHDVAAPPPSSFVTHYWKPTLQFSPPVSTDAIPLTEYHSVTLFESRTTIESGTTGLRTWRASFVLAQFLIQNPSMACASGLFLAFTHPSSHLGP